MLGLEGLDLAAVLTLPRSLLANLLGHELVELAIAADHEDVVVGDGAEGLVLHGICAVHPLGFVGNRCQHSNGRSESDEVADERHPSRGGAAEFDAIAPEVEGSGANHQGEGRS